jgi:hypothetical protein
MAGKIRQSEIIQAGQKLLVTLKAGKRAGERVGEDLWRVVNKIMRRTVNGCEYRRPAWVPAFHGAPPSLTEIL